MRPIANFSILRMILIIFITLQAFDTCYAQVRQEWAARFNSRVDDSDYANAITVDRDGNIYVTGSGFGDAGHSDYVTLKYDSTGNQLWMARYSGGGCEYCSNGGVNYATAIALSVEGNVYVTGTGSSALDGMAEYATIKYDTNGNQLWVATYRGLLTTGSSVNHAKPLTVDGQGNVYVTGTSFRSGGSEYDYMDYATVKYDGNGNEIWAPDIMAPAVREHRTAELPLQLMKREMSTSPGAVGGSGETTPP